MAVKLLPKHGWKQIRKIGKIEKIGKFRNIGSIVSQISIKTTSERTIYCWLKATLWIEAEESTIF